MEVKDAIRMVAANAGNNEAPPSLVHLFEVFPSQTFDHPKWNTMEVFVTGLPLFMSSDFVCFFGEKQDSNW